MRKIYLLLALAVVASIGINFYYFFDVLNQQVAFQEQVIEKQLQRAKNAINATAVDFENEIVYLFDPSDFETLFDENARAVEVIRKTGLFFSKYHNLVNSIKVFDTSGNAFQLSKDSVNYFKTRIYKKPDVNFREEKFQVDFKEGHAIYKVPVKRDEKLFGKVLVNLEFRQFLAEVLSNYSYNKREMHWIVDDNKHVIYKNSNYTLSESAKSAVLAHKGDSLSVFRKPLAVDGNERYMLTAVAPVEVMNSRIMMAFSMPLSHIRHSVIQKTLINAGITFVILLFAILAYIYLYRQLQKKNHQLRNSNYRFNSVIDNLEDMVLITDLRNETVYFSNKALQRCHNYNRIREFIKQQTQYNKAEEIKIGEKWYEMRMLKTQWTEDRQANLHAIADVTLRKTSEEKIVRSEETFRQIFQLLPVGIFIVDEENRIAEMNDQAVNIFSINNREQYIGREISEALNLQPYTGNEGRSGDDKNKYLLQSADNYELIVYRKRIPIKYNKGNAYLESFTDITSIEEKRQGEVLANKAKSEFIANLSHEIRTPLNGVTGMADALLNAELPDETKEYADVIKKSSELLQTIINDILDLSKIESGRMQLEEIPFNLREELEHAVRGFRVKAREKSIALEMHVQETIGQRFIGDPFRLKQVLTNLLSNAVKFTQHGKISMSVEKVRERMGMNILLFTVEDSGIGIPKSKINKIFESFSQADVSTTRKYGGTGLGTTISKQLVEMMGGEIWAESPSSLKISDEYPGTKFMFTVELYSDEKLPKSMNFSDVRQPSDLNILVVDDQPQNNKTLNDALARVTTNVTFANNKHHAEKLIQDNLIHTSRFHLVFIEDREDFNGFEVMSHLFHNGIADWMLFVLMSSNDQTGNYTKSKRLHADYYIIKPFQAADIFAIIHESFSDLKLAEDYTKAEETSENVNILIAEDNSINQKVIRTLFKSLGYETEMANNGNEVLHKVREKSYDLLLMDILMPDKDGIETTRELRNSGYKMPIIALTGGITERDKRAAEEAGMNDHLSKPVKLTNLKNIVLKWLQALDK